LRPAGTIGVLLFQVLDGRLLNTWQRLEARGLRQGCPAQAQHHPQNNQQAPENWHLPVRLATVRWRYYRNHFLTKINQLAYILGNMQ
jgi:hypothetical protein